MGYEVCCRPAVRCRLSADVLSVLWSGGSTGQKLHLAQHCCWGQCPLVLMQAAHAALTLFFCLVLSHMHMDTFPFILCSYQS